MSLLPIELPRFNEPVRAIVKQFEHWKPQVVELVAVDEDDCSWRFLVGNDELAYEWNVVYWEYIPVGGE